MQVIEARRSYYANIAFVDEQIGRLLQSINLTDTWIIHLSDHGDGQGKSISSKHLLFRRAASRWPQLNLGMSYLKHAQMVMQGTMVSGAKVTLTRYLRTSPVSSGGPMATPLVSANEYESEV